MSNSQDSSVKKVAMILDQICEDYCAPGKHCILKQMVLSNHTLPRLLNQLKCLERYKYDINKDKKEEISWNDAGISWVESGCAKAFAEEYDEDVRFDVIYKRVIAKVNSTTTTTSIRPSDEAGRPMENLNNN